MLLDRDRIKEGTTSISSNSFELSFLDEDEDVGIACWSVETSGSVANTNSERVSSIGSTISIQFHCPISFSKQN